MRASFHELKTVWVDVSVGQVGRGFSPRLSKSLAIYSIVCKIGSGVTDPGVWMNGLSRKTITTRAPTATKIGPTINAAWPHPGLLRSANVKREIIVRSEPNIKMK